ncbi:MAG: DUF92 domain-containing protein [Anaerolineae bacterium]|nr:MAG: DUF92 domain-containing protein [Anaerolineae bacterium]
MPQFFLGLCLSSLIAWLAYQQRLLTGDGAAGAVVMGTFTVTAGWGWGLVLIAFFVSSSAFSRIGEQRKSRAREQFDKGEQRDLWQVLANGGVGTFLAVLYLLIEEKHLWLPYLASFATMNADTWATEIGTMSRQIPRLITDFRKVEPGTSGAVTVSGTLASLIGAGFIGAVGGLLDPFSFDFFTLLVLVTLAGLMGSLCDSVLGATVQALYWCDDQQKLTEKSICQNGAPAEHRKGFRWINNDVVNFSAALCGGGVGAVLVTLVL